MIFKGDRCTEWRKRFALFPTSVEKESKVVWLGFYWVKYVPGDVLCMKCELAANGANVVGHYVTSATEPKEITSGQYGG